MIALLHWVTANPARVFLAGAILALLAMPVPAAAWVPGAFVAFAVLAGGPTLGGLAVAGAALVLLFVYGAAVGIAPVTGVAIAMLVPAYLGARLLASTRSLSSVFQWLTLGAVVLVLALRGLLGDPQGFLAPLLTEMESALRETATILSDGMVRQFLQRFEATVARVAWAALTWLILLHAMVSQFAGLWAFGKLREPGVFGREFRQLQLGRFIAWLLVAAIGASVASQYFLGRPMSIAEDIVFVLSASFLLQALAVIHGLRELQVIGVLPVILAYLAVLTGPTGLLLTGIGLADAWLRFRERFKPKLDGTGAA
jgi:hypothetical protein